MSPFGKNYQWRNTMRFLTYYAMRRLLGVVAKVLDLLAKMLHERGVRMTGGDDVIERAARAVYNHQVPAGLKCLTIQWEEAHETQRDHFLSVARAALTAALGIEGDE